MAIETEVDWLTCVEPRDFAQFCRGRIPTERFRWLAVSWGDKIRHYLQVEDELLYFEAYKAWVEGHAGHPSTQLLPEIWSPLDIPMPVFSDARFFIEWLSRGDPLRAAGFAASSSGYDFPHFGTARPVADPAHSHKKKSKKGCAEAAAARKAAHERLERERDAHRERTLWQFANEFRDVAGNPFRPISFDPAWRSETVVGLAVGIDEDGAYERLPILADALEEAGCADPQVLSHAREPGVHVRGCWLIDMVLGRWG